jgi:hypothetical protein
MKRKQGRTQIAAWLSDRAFEKLSTLADDVGQSKTAMLEHIILTWGTQHGPVVRGKHAEAYARGVTVEVDELDSDEPIPEPVRRHRSRPRAEAIDLNAPQTLAERIRAAGTRRIATVLSTGERAVEGRLRPR